MCQVERLEEFCKVIKESKDLDTIQESQELIQLTKFVQTRKDELSSQSRTAKLWIQYLDYVDLVKMFVRAERTGDWSLHLVAISRMINLFASTGHINYAKSARLYLQLDVRIAYRIPMGVSFFY